MSTQKKQISGEKKTKKNTKNTDEISLNQSMADIDVNDEHKEENQEQKEEIKEEKKDEEEITPKFVKGKFVKENKNIGINVFSVTALASAYNNKDIHAVAFFEKVLPDIIDNKSKLEEYGCGNFYGVDGFMALLTAFEAEESTGINWKSIIQISKHLFIKHIPNIYYDKTVFGTSLSVTSNDIERKRHLGVCNFLAFVLNEMINKLKDNRDDKNVITIINNITYCSLMISADKNFKKLINICQEYNIPINNKLSLFYLSYQKNAVNSVISQMLLVNMSTDELAQLKNTFAIETTNITNPITNVVIRGDNTTFIDAVFSATKHMNVSDFTRIHDKLGLKHTYEQFVDILRNGNSNLVIYLLKNHKTLLNEISDKNHMRQMVLLTLKCNAKAQIFMFNRLSEIRGKWCIFPDVFLEVLKHPEIKNLWSMIHKWVRFTDNSYTKWTTFTFEENPDALQFIIDTGILREWASQTNLRFETTNPACEIVLEKSNMAKQSNELSIRKMSGHRDSKHSSRNEDKTNIRANNKITKTTKTTDKKHEKSEKKSDQKPKKKYDGPKNFLSPFKWYCKINSTDFSSEYPNITDYKELKTKMYESWSELSDEDKEEYVVMSNKDRIRFFEEKEQMNNGKTSTNNTTDKNDKPRKWGDQVEEEFNNKKTYSKHKAIPKRKINKNNETE